MGGRGDNAERSRRAAMSTESSGGRWWSKLIQPRIGPNVGLRTVPNHSV